MYIRVNAALIPVAIAALAPWATFAQTAAQGGGAAGEGLEEVFVTARKVEQNLQRVPVAITALSGDALEQSSVREMRDLSSVAPSLNIKASGSGPQSLMIALRGQAQSGILLTQDVSVGIYVDGINNPRRLGLRGELIDLQQVEVLRGPQGTLFGRNTTGGAITITSKKPTEEFGGEVRAQVGNFDSTGVVGIFNAPLSDNIASRFVFNRTSRGPYTHDVMGRPLGDEDSTYLRGKVMGKWDAFEVEVTAHHETYDSGGPMTVLTGLTPASLEALPNVSNRQIAAELGLPATEEGLAEATRVWQEEIYRGSGYKILTDTSQYSKSKSSSLGVIATWTASDMWTFKSLTGYLDLERNDRVDIDGTRFSIYDVTLPTDDTFISQEFQAIGSFDNVDLVAGLYADYEDGNDGQSAVISPLVLPSYSIIDGDVTSQSLAAFVQANWHITDRLTATGGGRYTREEKKLVSHNHRSNGTCSIPASLLQTPGVCSAKFSDTYTDPSWLASLDYELGGDALVYGKVSRGTKAGGQNLRGQNTEAAFESFEPEEVTEYEVGLKSMFFDRRMRLNLATFYDDYKNVQRQILTDGGATTRVTNAASATIYGAELESTISVTDGLTVTASAGYVNAEYDEFADFSGDRSGEDWPTPDWVYSIAAQYSAPVQVGEVALQLNYQGQSKQNLSPGGKLRDQLTQPAFGLLNGTLKLKLDEYAMEVALYGRNLTNELNFIGGIALEPLGYNMLNLGAPRTYGIEVTAYFGGEK